MKSGEMKVDDNTRKAVKEYLHKHRERIYSWGQFYSMGSYKTGRVNIGRGRWWGLYVYPDGSVTRVN